jgi:hypothetical protein
MDAARGRLPGQTTVTGSGAAMPTTADELYRKSLRACDEKMLKNAVVSAR